MTRTTELQQALARVHADMAAACAACGRDRAEVSLLPVSKFHPVSDIKILHSLGVVAVGENRVQEACAKHDAMPGMAIIMIGQIQTNKANAVARFATGVQSVDSVKLACALDRGMSLALERGERDGKDSTLPVHIQLSLDGDPHRGGMTEEHLSELVDTVAGSDHLHLAGLMCVPPRDSDPAAAFAQARAVADSVADNVGYPMELSAGMTHDLWEAIAAGSTLVRVGTGIFGKRPLH